MFLRSLSLRGFKSFANKSILRFEPGITAIVGPNGSGKSNITDAALWVLGEQSARSLRGSTMQDVIFSGSTTRQSLGVAEVSLVLDNSDGTIPIEFSEVTILRRCYRSGESEYYINGSPCRLIDIQELLSDSGLGREMYSIISQGKIDDILNSRPEELRQLIDEAAGVLKHKKRKERALRKLTSMADKLTRARDILKEISRQLMPLEKQANVTEIHAKLTEELREVEVALAVIELRQYQESWEAYGEQLNKYQQEIDELKEQLEVKEAVVAECEEELEVKGVIAGDIGEHRRRVEGILQQVNSGLLLLEEKGRNLIERLSELRQKIYQLERRQAGNQEELSQLETERETADRKLTNLYSDLAELRKQAEHVKKESRRVNEVFEDLRSRLGTERRRLENAQHAHHENATAKLSAKEQVDFLQNQLTLTRSRLKNLLREKLSIESSLEKLQTGRQPLDAEIIKVQRLIESLSRDATNARRDYETTTAEHNNIAAKKAVLNDLTDKRSSSNAAAWLLGERQKIAGLLGTVGDVIVVKKKYDRAIEAVLAQDVHSLVAKDFSTITTALELLKERQDGFISMVPAQSKSKHSPELKFDWATPALDVVDCDALMRPAIELLLDRVFIVNNLREIIERINELPTGCLWATLSGEILTERGIVRRGVFSGENFGLLGCHRELAELQEREVVIEAKVAVAAKALQLLEADLDKKKQQLLDLSAKRQSLDSQIANHSARERDLKEQCAVLSEQEIELKQRIDVRLNELKDESQNEYSAQVSELKSVVAKIEAQLNSLRQEREKQIEKEKATMQQLGECQVEIASLTERQVHLKRRSISVSAELNDFKEALAHSIQVEAALENLRGRIEPVHGLYSELRLIAEDWERSLRESAEKEIGKTKEIREQLKAAQDSVRGLSEQLDNKRQAATDIQVKQGQLEVQVNSTIQRLVDELQVPIERALEIVPTDISSELYERKQRRLRAKLAELGPVNPLAVQEYQQLSQRQQFISKHVDDLIKSRRALEKVVKAIECKIEEEFFATFNKVNTHFQRVFAELFPGGRVALILTEADDESEAGIEIEAQPHGKALQALSLLSGGEKALVGLALLFAIYYTRPSPFYILDEVEAALDDINLQRFINLLNKMKADTQILIITHQRRTMETADSLYGVSMQADGVSKLISQKMTEATPSFSVEAEGMAPELKQV